MEKRSISGKDILRMDGLLPPTRRLPVCDAVTSQEKKKEKKWSLGGILKRISSIRDCDSSSNDEEIVYCTTQPRRPCTVFNRKAHNVILRPVDKTSNQHLTKDVPDVPGKSVDLSSLQRDSMLSRSSEGSLEGLSKKARKSKLKARVEAKRDRICADSSSDEDSRISSNSLTRYQNEIAMQTAQKSSSGNRKSRAARTERYIKRLSRDEAQRFPENLNDIASKRNSLDSMNQEHSSVTVSTDELYQRPQQLPSFSNYINSHTFPVEKSAENFQQSGVAASNYQVRSSVDLTKHPTNRYVKDLNQNTYAKPKVFHKNKNLVDHGENTYFFNSSMPNTDYVDPYDPVRNRQSVKQSSFPPEPPPRDPHCRVFSCSSNSFPFNGKHDLNRYDDTLRMKVNDIHEVTKDHLKSLRFYESSNESNWHGSIAKECPRRPLSLTTIPIQSCNLSDCTNNRHCSTGKHVIKPTFTETEEMKCQRRNDRNDQLTSCFKDYDSRARDNNSSTTFIKSMENTNNLSSTFDKPIEPTGTTSLDRKSTQKQFCNAPNDASAVNKQTETATEELTPSEQERERRRSSKNLEEALFELETIYNSLRLGDEDLLDRAERRSMEEFSLRQAKTETVPLIMDDLTDRSKDDMAYRRMHPKERPASLSEVTGQSVLSNISYLIASPILSRKDETDDHPNTTNYPTRRDEPDVTRDDVVYRSIHRANNTLKVADPQPPFGIPLGPVTTATESDYLHTTPSKQQHPRSPYIPRCEPDIVTDDLAYRTLRKDANGTPKSGIENEKDQEVILGTKKKRAVRSLSANLYGLINHDRIHLRREPSLREIKDEMSDMYVDIESLPVRSNRRVVSDSELSDYDTRWRTDNVIKVTKTDINGNHSVTNTHSKKLRVYISPSSQVQNFTGDLDEDRTVTKATASNDILSKAMNNQFWQDCVQTESPDLSNEGTESDFTAYSRLCQDLVNLIDGPSDMETKRTDETSLLDNNENMDKASVLHIQSLGSQYTETNDESVKENVEEEEADKWTVSFAKTEDGDSEKTDDKTFDFYLRVADENVKLIAEAFSSVADHLRDSRSSQKNLLTSQRSEIETDSTAPNTSTRSSVTYSLDDTNDDLSSSSIINDVLNVVPKEETTLKEENHKLVEDDAVKIHLESDSELDLTQAVYNLQLAAASLCDHKPIIEKLGTYLNEDSSSNASNDNDKDEEIENNSSLYAERGLVPRNEVKELEDVKEETVISTDDKSRTDECDPNSEGESIECEDTCESYETAGSTEIYTSYVTNLITVLITTYSMVLLACFLALLLATVAAS